MSLVSTHRASKRPSVQSLLNQDQPPLNAPPECSEHQLQKHTPLFEYKNPIIFISCITDANIDYDFKNIERPNGFHIECCTVRIMPFHSFLAERLVDFVSDCRHKSK